MSEAVRWWLILQVVSIPLAPLCAMLFARLPDRGYALSKPFALLLLGYAFWLLNSMRILPNSPRGILLALALLVAITVAAASGRRDELRGWFLENARYVLAVEILLLVVFLLAVWLRSFVGSIQGTEQPMDLMFVNAATRAEHFPPKDPWLSGSNVAYYYFGYLIVAMTGQLANVETQVGYNLGLAMVAALAFVGGAGLVYNLVRLRESALAGAADRTTRALLSWKPLAFGLAGGLMLVVMGNLVGFLQFLSAYGFGGGGFYNWIDVQDLTANEPRESWYPSDFFAFFNASRIYPFSATDPSRVITEFPMFSFLLGDLHPHVMALPFVLLAVGLALTLFRSEEPLDVVFWLRRPLVLVAAAVIVGGLSFLNTWDIGTMAFLVVVAAAVSNFMRVRALTLDLLVQAVTFTLPLVVLAVVAYVPFYAGFSSQANGIAAVVSRPGITEPGTRPMHAIIFWAPLFVAVVPFALARLAAARTRIRRNVAALSLGPLGLVLLGWLLVFGWEQARDSGHLAGAGGLWQQVGDRGSGWLTALAFGLVLAVALLALWAELTAEDRDDEREPVIFSLLLASTALLLVLGTEFFYVGDLFNSRMNTVFKLYYQAWLLLSISGGYALYYLASKWRFSFREARPFRRGWAAAVVIVLGAAALYPMGGTFNRTDGFDAKGQLAGLHYFPRDELEAIGWLNDRADDQELVIAEAVGNDYSEKSRISAATGIPTIIGWGGHEDQWRGSSAPRAGRFEDVNELYQTPDMERATQILQKYGVTHVYVGAVERTAYPEGGLDKFQSLPVAFQSGSVTIYRAPAAAREVTSAQ